MVLTPKEQEEIETMDLEEFNEELGKVRFPETEATPEAGVIRQWATLANRSYHTFSL